MNEQALAQFAHTLAAKLTKTPFIVFLKGDLGAGKTTLVRHILSSLGYTGKIKSPTYSLVEPYEISGRRIYHFDLYRLKDPEELEFLGAREYFQEGLCFIEWPELALGHLPPADWILDLRILSPETREITLTVSKNFISRFKIFKHYFAMCSVGLLGAAIQFSVFNLLNHHLSPALANALGTEAAIISNFIFNNRFTFRHRQLPLSKEFFKKFLHFNFFSLGSLAFQAAWLAAGVALLGRGSLLENFLVASGIVIGSVGNYFIYSRFIWPHKEASR